LLSECAVIPRFRSPGFVQKLRERVQFSEYLPAAEYVTKISEDFTVLKHEKMGLVCN
jgi:hypothetical protein